MRRRFRFQVLDADVALLVTGDRHDFHSGHRRAGRICAMRGSRDEANPAMRLAAAFVKAGDDEQPGVFALRTSVRLERNAGEPGDLREPRFKLLEKFLVTARLFDGREGMNLRELRPRDWKHLGGSVQLHGARSERDHRSREGQITRLQPAEIPQHLGLGMVGVEYRVSEKIAGTRETIPKPHAGLWLRFWFSATGRLAGKGSDQIENVGFRFRFIDASVRRGV